MPNEISPAIPAASVPATAADGAGRWRGVSGRRSFLTGVGLAGVAALPGSALPASEASAKASSAITEGDVAILRSLAAAKLIGAGLWQQHDELGGVSGGNPA
jgi:hypothetical protein